jgi:hypothetical protein
MSIGNITRRGAHSWRLKFGLGRDLASGKRQIRYVTVKGTKKQVQAELAKIIASSSTGQYVDVSKETVAEFADRWLRDWAATNISNKTYIVMSSYFANMCAKGSERCRSKSSARPICMACTPPWAGYRIARGCTRIGSSIGCCATPHNGASYIRTLPP